MNGLIFDAASWADAKLKFAVNREYDLAKFLFTVAVGTIGFLFTAEKLDAAAKLEWRLILSLVLLLGAIGSSVWMAIVAPPDPKTAEDVSQLTMDIHDRTMTKLRWWFGLWVVGTALGVWAVLPEATPAAPPPTS